MPVVFGGASWMIFVLKDQDKERRSEQRPRGNRLLYRLHCHITLAKESSLSRDWSSFSPMNAMSFSVLEMSRVKIHSARISGSFTCILRIENRKKRNELRQTPSFLLRQVCFAPVSIEELTYRRRSRTLSKMTIVWFDRRQLSQSGSQTMYVDQPCWKTNSLLPAAESVHAFRRVKVFETIVGKFTERKCEIKETNDEGTNWIAPAFSALTG